MNYIVKLSFVLMIGLLVYACGDEEDELDLCDGMNATYNGDVGEIINNSCAFFGCHNGSNGNIPEASRDYTTFEGMATAISGGFNERVLVQMNMPISPGEITAADLQILQCWHDAGYPEQ